MHVYVENTGCTFSAVTLPHSVRSGRRSLGLAEARDCQKRGAICHPKTACLVRGSWFVIGERPLVHVGFVQKYLRRRYGRF